jgi:serine/threonine-protein kinase
LGDASETSTTVPVGNVIDLRDASGNSLAGKTEAVNTPITVVVSSGRQQTTVPDVTGHRLGEAENTLRGNGFTVGQISYQVSANVPADAVISQSPSGGSQAGQGTSVSLVVSTGSPTPSPSDSAGVNGGLNGGGSPTPTTSATKSGMG